VPVSFESGESIPPNRARNGCTRAQPVRADNAAQVRDSCKPLKQEAFGAPGAHNVVSMLGK
jgi:hypothetical protein